jgi:uncharacterized protein YkwD
MQTALVSRIPIALLAATLLLAGCTYQYVPQQVQHTQAPRHWSESESARKEAEFAAILTRERQQRRRALRRNPVLDSVARARAWDMARRGYFAHVNPDGIGPNTLVQRAGFSLPSTYDLSPRGNNIESAAGGYGTAETAWRWFMRSSHHRTHLLGLNPVFAEQTEFGVGYVWRPNSRYEHYWVVLIADPAERRHAVGQ